MAYEFGRQQITMFTTGGLPAIQAHATTAVARLVYRPLADVVIQAVGVVSLTTKAGAPAFSFRNTATAGASSASGTEFSRITVTTAALRGEAWVRKGLNVTASAGSEVVCQVKTAATGCRVAALLYVQNKPYNFANQSQVTLVTT
jgi:hypothetical protein